MRLQNHIETVRLGALDGDEIFGEVRVRGIDALDEEWGGFLFAQQVPLRVNVRRRDGAQVADIPSPLRLPGTLTVVAAPVVAFVVARLVVRRNRKTKED